MKRLLCLLAARGVHATFFLCGYRIDLYPELAARQQGGQRGKQA